MNDEGSAAGWGVLSFFFPIVGLVLFCVWKNEKPHSANVCGICALVSFCTSVLFFIFYIAIIIGIIASLGPATYYLISFLF